MDSVISAVTSPIINSIITPLIQEVKYILNPEANVTDLNETSRALRLTKEEVQEQIAASTSASDEVVATERVKEWMDDVGATELDISKIVDDYSRRTTCFGGRCTLNCWSSYRISKRAAIAAMEAKKLISRKQSFDVLTKRCPPAIRRMLTLSDATMDSSQRYLSTVFDYLRDEDVGMVGIWGMGGVGKTTLLRQINNDPSLSSARFDYVIWLVVSQELDLDRLQNDTAKRLGLAFEEGTSTLESRARAIYLFLKTKSFLLLLDDVWDPIELARLGMPCPVPDNSGDSVPKRKVVFTTRSETDCEHMMACQKLQLRCKKIKIECLQPEEAWKLFLHNIGESTRTVINTDKRVRSRAEKVAEKCGGLPLAIVVIARAMSANKTWQEWEDAINSLNKMGIQEMWHKGADPFTLLKISYDRLPSDIVKDCFLSCALWPEDLGIWEFDLINCWRGMNLIDDCSDLRESYNRGYAILQILKRACLLEEIQGDYSPGASVKMHDIIREMALWIMSDYKKEWVVINQAKLKGEPEEYEAKWKEAKTISLMHGRSEMQLPQCPDCPNLSSLMLGWNHINVIPDRFFQNMNGLTYLDLSGNRINEIPAAIEGLSQLRYLDLGNNPISSLPMELGNLFQLKHLSVRNSGNLKSIPRGLISRLHKLAHLDISNTAFDAWDSEGQANIEELVCSRITSLMFDFRRLETLEQISKNPPLSLWLVFIRDLVGVTTLYLQSLLRIGNTGSTLLQLIIWDCSFLEEIFIDSQAEVEFDNLELFELNGCHALNKITTAGGSVLRNIRFLYIYSCTRLKNATWIMHLPYLESLEIETCNEMEHVIDDEDNDNIAMERIATETENMVTFSNLKHLILRGLPELRSFSTRAFQTPSLRYLSIYDCPKFDNSIESA